MGYKFEDALRRRAEEFIRALRSAGISGELIEDSFRDYSVKVSVSAGEREFGKANIHYSPKSDSFSLKTHELKDKSIVPQLEACWHDRRSPEKAEASGYHIYVDGSFINGATGYGAVMLKDGKVVDELLGAVSDPSLAYARQVAGELFAVEEALRWCKRNSINKVSIFYDYLGIEKWATGRWKANQPLTRKYREFVRDSGVRIKWHKVDSHTGNRWNDRADRLAKKGAGAAAHVASDDERMSELLEMSDRFIEFLMLRGLEASFDRIFNDQFARLLIVEDDKRAGIFDLYHTRKKPFSPYLHDFKDEEMKSKVEALWNEFRIAECGMRNAD